MSEPTTSVTPKKLGLELLREPFPAHLISKLPKPTRRENPKGKCAECGGFHGLPAVHLDYVGHAALTHRLLDADPSWTWEPLAVDAQGLPQFDKNGCLWIKLTVCNVTRLGYGQAEQKATAEIGAREKEVIGDALRNAAMRFGAALDLWSKADLHAEDETQPTKEEGPAQYPDAEFTANFVSWKKLLEHGSKSKETGKPIFVTADDIIAKIETRGKLSEEQKAKLRAITRVRTKADVEDAMRAAADVDSLSAIVGEQVSAVASKEDRSTLMALAAELEMSLTGVQV